MEPCVDSMWTVLIRSEMAMTAATLSCYKPYGESEQREHSANRVSCVEVESSWARIALEEWSIAPLSKMLMRGEGCALKNRWSTAERRARPVLKPDSTCGPHGQVQVSQIGRSYELFQEALEALVVCDQAPTVNGRRSNRSWLPSQLLLSLVNVHSPPLRPSSCELRIASRRQPLFALGGDDLCISSVNPKA
jgi:hypothetical protein